MVYLFISETVSPLWRGLYGIVANVQDRDIIVSEFKFQLHCYIHFWAYALGKSMNPLVPTAMV